MIDWDIERDIDYLEEDTDNYENGNEAKFVFDTYDRIIDEEELFAKSNDGLDLGPDDIGLAFAFAEAVMDEEKAKKYDIDVNTDRENWERAQRFIALGARRKTGKTRLRPFEQYIDDICRGKINLFDSDSG